MNKKSILKARYFLAVATISAILLVLSVTPKQSNNDSTDITHVLRGEITEKRTGCGRELLSKDGTVKHASGICDAGNSLTVDGVSVSTGGGALVPLPVYISNIESLQPGDIVEIRYIKNQEGYQSTNCKSCYVRKSGSLKQEPQTLIERSTPRL